MTTEELIAEAREALGGLDRIRAVRSYHSIARRTTRPSGREQTVEVWRAAGGRVRIEERSGRTATVKSTESGKADEREELLRDARIAPRNMLAHADERKLVLRAMPSFEGTHVLSAPEELVLYFFDPQTKLCVRTIDLAGKRRIEMSDYRTVDGIATPFFERCTRENTDRGYEERFLTIEYNAPVPEGIFKNSQG
jgi:hypothetical protein